MIVLVLGGTRSGKTAVAEGLAARLPAPHAYVATGRATDTGMAARIAAHRAARPERWATVEVSDDLPGALVRLPGTLLVDSLGTWVAATLQDRDPDAPGAGTRGCADPAGIAVGDSLADVLADVLVGALRRRQGDTVLVSEEVGLAVHPVSAVGRRFVDVLGVVNQAVAELAGQVLLVVAGRVLPLGRSDEVTGP